MKRVGAVDTSAQRCGAIGIAILATVFFNALPTGAPAESAGSRAEVFGQALAHVMPWQVATYLLAAVAMLALPKTAATHQVGAVE